MDNTALLHVLQMHRHGLLWEGDRCEQGNALALHSHRDLGLHPTWSEVLMALAWQSVDLHTAPNGRSWPIRDPHTLSVPLNTQCILTDSTHWVQFHVHRDYSCTPLRAHTENTCKYVAPPQTGISANCSVSICICAHP